MKPIIFVQKFHRWSGVFLFLLIAIKLISGFILTGKIEIENLEVGYRMHLSAWIDSILVFIFLFHSAYGVYKMINSKITKKMTAFIVTNVITLVLFVLILVFVYI